ncbi:MAG: VOC family protein [Promethearchaeota archaeon]
MYFQLKVKDLERAKKFYEDVFNFNIAWYESPDIGWCEFDLPGGKPKLGLNTIGEGENFAEDSGTLTIEVKNIENAKKYLEDKGISTSEIVDLPNMVSFFNMNDTKGNRIQIVSEPRIKV